MDWASFSRVVISSTWDSVDRPVEYLSWARTVSSVSKLINPLPVLEWNLDKSYLRDLAAAGVDVIPTTWVAPSDHWVPSGRAEIVVKPSVSAGGRDTARYAAADPAAGVHVRRLQTAGQTVMVQDYLHTVDQEGELDVIFVGGEAQHAVHKLPALKTGQGVRDQPWEQMAWSGLAAPNAAQLSAAQQAMAVVADRLAGWPVYGRVDLISGRSGEPLVLEVELIDPVLSLDSRPETADLLAERVLEY